MVCDIRVDGDTRRQKREWPKMPPSVRFRSWKTRVRESTLKRFKTPRTLQIPKKVAAGLNLPQQEVTLTSEGRFLQGDREI